MVRQPFVCDILSQHKNHTFSNSEFFSGHLLSSLMTIGSKQPIEYLIRLISDWVHRNSSALRLIVVNSPLKACCTLKTTHLGKKHSSIISRSEKNGYHYSTHFRFDASALVKLLVILSKEEMNLLTGGIASYFQIGVCYFCFVFFCLMNEFTYRSCTWNENSK